MPKAGPGAHNSGREQRGVMHLLKSSQRTARRAQQVLLAVVACAVFASPGRGAPVISSAEYIVNAGDELDVFVWGEARMQRSVRVLPDGSFAFPLAGTVVAAGRTAPDIAKAITEGIKGNYRTAVPEVTVAVRDTAGARFYVVGKVRTPGAFSTGRATNVVQALSLAGGTVEFADVNNAVILRQNATGQSVERVRLADVMKGGRALRNGVQAAALPIMGVGDVLVIP